MRVKRHPELPPWRHDDLTPGIWDILTGRRFSVRHDGLFLRPGLERFDALRAVAVKHGRRPPPKAARA
jgi:hypothetical protein